MDEITKNGTSDDPSSEEDNEETCDQFKAPYSDCNSSKETYVHASYPDSVDNSIEESNKTCDQSNDLDSDINDDLADYHEDNWISLLKIKYLNMKQVNSNPLSLSLLNKICFYLKQPELAKIEETILGNLVEQMKFLEGREIESFSTVDCKVTTKTRKRKIYCKDGKRILRSTENLTKDKTSEVCEPSMIDSIVNLKHSSTGVPCFS